MNYDRVFINHRAKEKLGELRNEDVNVEKNSTVMVKIFLIILFLIIIMKMLVR